MAKITASERKTLRATNAGVAEAYDRVPYDVAGAPHVDPGCVRPLAAMHGLTVEQNDVLDLACGFGGHTVRMSRLSKGRVVGLDISRAACERTRERFARVGREADIRCVDLLDVQAEDLGQFDLIACIGTLYVVPEAVREKIFELIGKCLRPGGACLLSFYTGLSGYVTMELQRLIRAKLGPVEPSMDAVAQARGFLQKAIMEFRELQADPVVQRRAEVMAALPDGNLYHELFGPPVVNFTPMALHQRLASHGVQIAGIVPYDLAMLGPTPSARALSLDILDLMHGGYRYAMFGKWLGVPPAVNFDAPQVVWTSSFRRDPQAGEHAYRSPETGAAITVHGAHLRGFIEAVSERPRRWSEAVALACAQAQAEEPGAPFDENGLKRDAIWLWQSGSVMAALPDVPHPRFDGG